MTELIQGVKYCGGCNPRYDRSAMARRIEAELGKPLPSAQPGVQYDEVFVLHGCSAQCADLSLIDAKRFIMIDTEQEALPPQR